jgi:polyether ionophore transport system permease protein
MRTLTGTGRLIRVIVRRDRVRLPVWILAIGLSILGSVAGFTTAYPTAADRQARAAVLGSPVAKLFVGPGYGSDRYTFGAMTANELLPSAAIAVALMSVFLLVRHTRAEEESGREDLVRGTAVGRHAPLVAALTVVGAAHALLFVILAVGLPVSLDGLSTAGSVAFAAALLGVGVVFAGVAALVAQLTVEARSGIGIGAIVIGATYLIRAIGDISGNFLPWLSPFGWATEIRSFVDERWWALGPSAAAAAAAVAAALAINTRRDVGGGIVGPRGGAAFATPRLRTPGGLALRLQRGSLVVWSLAMLLLGAVYGFVAKDAGTFYEDVDALKDYVSRVGRGDPVEQFLALSIFISALIAVGFALQATLRLRTEEAERRAEPVLAARVGRTRWMGSHLGVALIGSVALLMVLGFGFGISVALDRNDASQIPRMVGASCAYAPALWVFVGLATALVGAAPRYAGSAWAVLGATAFVGFLGPLLKLPEWIFRVSPLEHVPKLPVADFAALPELVLIGVAGALLAFGVVAFRRRDLASG